MNINRKILNFPTNFVLILFFSAIEIFAQVSLVVPGEDQPEVVEDYTWWYILIFLLIVGLAGAVFWKIQAGKDRRQQETDSRNKQQERASEDNSVDFDKELEWFRKNKTVVDKRSRKKGEFPKGLPRTSRVLNGKKGKNGSAEQGNFDDADAAEYMQKLEKLEFSQSTIARFTKLELARPFSQLPISNDEALISAIEQTQDEFEEDEQVRELAVRILARFKTRNSVESLSQVALYDLSSSLRSKAIGILTDFDHESVFETLLMGCADPTREIRAAAARGLFRLSFDRADAWTRIAETDDEFRMRHAARAAIAGDLVERSLVRLVHHDRKVAYEALTLVALLLKAGETREIFNALENHKDINVRKAILHIIKITKEHNALDGLYRLLEDDKLTGEMREEVDSLVEEIGLVAA